MILPGCDDWEQGWPRRAANSPRSEGLGEPERPSIPTTTPRGRMDMTEPTSGRLAWRRGGVPLGSLARRVQTQVWAHDLLDRAAALSYYFLFALFPTLLFLTTLVGLLPIPHLMDQLVGYFVRVLPADAASLLVKTLGEIRSGANSGLLSLGVIAALWGASGGMLSIISALNA